MRFEQPGCGAPLRQAFERFYTREVMH